MTIDDVCRQTTNPTLLNALHACRPGHPWNKTTAKPFTAALFLAAQQPFPTRLSAEAEAWLERQAKGETQVHRYYITHTDENGERHRVAGTFEAETPEAAIAAMLAEAQAEDDGRWEAHESLMSSPQIKATRSAPGRYEVRVGATVWTLSNDKSAPVGYRWTLDAGMETGEHHFDTKREALNWLRAR